MIFYPSWIKELSKKNQYPSEIDPKWYKVGLLLYT